LATTHVKGQYGDAKLFTADAADLLLDIHSYEPETSLSLLAVTLMNENTRFNLTIYPNPNPDQTGKERPRDWWDVGPFGLNLHYVVSAIATLKVSLKGLDVDEVFGKKMEKDQPFNGKPVANGRMAARYLQAVGGKTDRQKAINYAGRDGRGDSWDSFHSLFERFFACYRRQ
jgi:hypothetical protein